MTTSTNLNASSFAETENVTQSSSEAQSPLLAAAVVGPPTFTFIFCTIGIYIRKKYQIWRIRKDMILHEVQGKISVNFPNLEVLERLGGGNFGDVYKGIYKGSVVALKGLKTEEQLEEFRREAVIL